MSTFTKELEKELEKEHKEANKTRDGLYELIRDYQATNKLSDEQIARALGDIRRSTYDNYDDFKIFRHDDLYGQLTQVLSSFLESYPESYRWAIESVIVVLAEQINTKLGGK